MKIFETWICFKSSKEWVSEEYVEEGYFNDFKDFNVGDKVKILEFDEEIVVIKALEKTSNSERWDKTYFLKHFKKLY